MAGWQLTGHPHMPALLTAQDLQLRSHSRQASQHPWQTWQPRLAAGRALLRPR